MSTAVRRLVSLGLVAVIVAVGAWVYLSQGDNPPDHLSTPAPGPARIDEDTSQLRALKARAGIANCNPGTAKSGLPDVTLPCLGGGPAVNLSTLKGPMLLSFWFAGCGPCKKEMPVLESFDQRYGKQVPVLGVDFLDLYPASAIAMMHRHGATYPSLADPGGDLQGTSSFAKVRNGLPLLYFVDAQGRIAYAHPGGVTSQNELTGLVREHLGIDL